MTSSPYALRLRALLAAGLALSSLLPSSAVQAQKARQENNNDPRYYVYVNGIT